MLTIALKKLEIFNLIVLLISIPVMNDFSWQEMPPKGFFHHQPVFKHVVGVLPGIRMTFYMKQDITILIHGSTFPSVMLLPEMRGFWKLFGYACAAEEFFHLTSHRPNGSGDLI